MTDRPRQLLTINTGSSSLKAGLYDVGEDGDLILAVAVDRIGQGGSEGSRLRAHTRDGSLLTDEPLPEGGTGHGAALRSLLRRLDQQGWITGLAAVGHRLVHGGQRFGEPAVISDEVLADLWKLVPLAPLHLPQALDAIAAIREQFPAMLQVGCFDTAFHRTMPDIARRYPLPSRFADEGIVRYGFHGLSYESIIARLRQTDPGGLPARTVIAHLGNGSSMVALRDGISVETTMGFTPAGGLMMGTRTGDLDPGVILYLLQQQGMSPAEINDLITRQSGLTGVAGTTSDMRDLLAREASDPRAAEAVALYCYQAVKWLGALTAILGGLDLLVFSGGIGEHAAPVRARICAAFAFLGLQLDQVRNRAGAPVISAPGSAVTVVIVPSDEDGVIARQTARLLRERGAEDVSV